jgi:hypothetical protein
MNRSLSDRYIAVARMTTSNDYYEGYRKGLRHFQRGTLDKNSKINLMLERGGEIKQGVLDGLAGISPKGISINDPGRKGRPRISYDEPSHQISTSIPMTIYSAIPVPKPDWLRQAITEKLRNELIGVG